MPRDKESFASAGRGEAGGGRERPGEGRGGEQRKEGVLECTDDGRVEVSERQAGGEGGRWGLVLGVVLLSP